MNGMNGGIFGPPSAAQIAAALGYTPANPAVVPQILGMSGTAASVSSGTAEVQLGGIPIPAGVMGLNGGLRVTTFWQYTNSVNNKTLRVKFGGSGGTTIINPTQTLSASFIAQLMIWNNNSAALQKMFNSNSAFGSTSSTPTTAAINTANATSVYISGQPASAGEVITLEGYLVELLRGV